MLKRKKLPLPTKDWRDPNMPVSFSGKLNGKYGIHELSASEITNYYRCKLEQIGWQMPSWNDDPSYWWSQTKNKSK